MYLKKLRFENTGPIDILEMEIPVQDENAPQPLVFVGQNGSGKSIVLAHIVSAMISAHNAAFEDSDVEKGKVYKLRSPSYIRREQDYSLSCLEFSDGFYEDEIMLRMPKRAFEENLKYSPIFKKFEKHNADATSSVHSNFHEKIPEVRKTLAGPHLYFPPNRFEEPAWLNEISLKNTINYFQIMGVEGYSNRPVIQYAPMKENQSWLLDIVYDSYAIEKKTTALPKIEGVDQTLHLVTHNGPATAIRNHLQEFILLLLGGKHPVQWNLGQRSKRTISIVAAGEILTNNLFSLSTGQAVLLDLFVTIIRHADLTGQDMSSLSQVKGLVVIDEVDLHLHADLQHEILPHIISLFPKVQFIMSTHSPLFLLGLERKFGEDGISIVELPNGVQITAERFSEFESAYKHLTNTRKFENDLNRKISQATQPLLLVEGTIDIDYIRKAAEHLGEEELLNRFEFVDGDGHKGLDKIWKNLYIEKWDNISQIVVLLYDCDVKEKNNEIGKAFQRTIPLQDGPIEKGIENLLSKSTIDRARDHKTAFIDYTAASSGTKRGKAFETSEYWTINPDEKRNLCNWLCEEGTSEDFENFTVVFDILRECLGSGLITKR